MKTETNPKSQIPNPKSECGMSLVVVMAVLMLFAIALLAVAPTVQQGVQRDKELESIRRGEEVADAIRQYVTFYRGTKLPDSIDELLEGIPQGTKKRQILRASAAVDPLSEDGKWRLIKPASKAFLNFGGACRFTMMDFFLRPVSFLMLLRFRWLILSTPKATKI